MKNNTLNLRYIFLIIGIVMLISFTSALTDLGTFKQNQDLRITQVCSDATYINKYLEVDNMTFLNGGLNMTLQNITNIQYACFDETCAVYLRYNGTCIISSNNAGACI